MSDSDFWYAQVHEDGLKESAAPRDAFGAVRLVVDYDGVVTESTVVYTDPDDGVALRAKFWVSSDPIYTDEHGATTRISQGFACAEEDRPSAGDRIHITVSIVEEEA